MSTLTTLNVRIGADISGFQKEMGKLETRMKGIGEGLKSFGKSASLFVSAPIAAAGAKMIQAASDAQEMQAKFNTVFSNTGQGVTGRLTEFGNAVGRSVVELKGMASQFGDTLKPMGFAEEAAANLAVDLTKLATDLSSFNNMPMDEALRRLQGTLVGSHENALAFGVVINENTLKAQMLEDGTSDLTGAQFEQAKVQARINLLMKGTSDAQGDAARTSESFANKVRALTARIQDVAVELGNHLIPIATAVVEKVTAMVAWVSDLSDEQQRLALTVGAAVAAIGPLAVGLGVVLAALSPIAVAIAAVVAGGVALYANWQQVTDFMQEAWMRMKVRVMGAVVELLEGFENVVGWIPGAEQLIGPALVAMRTKTHEAALELSKFKIEQGNTRKATEESKKALEQQVAATQAASQAVKTATTATHTNTEVVEENTEAVEFQASAIREVKDLNNLTAQSIGKVRLAHEKNGDQIEEVTSEMLRQTTAVENLADESEDSASRMTTAFAVFRQSLTGPGGLLDAFGQGGLGGALSMLKGGLLDAATTAFPALGVGIKVASGLMKTFGIDSEAVLNKIKGVAAGVGKAIGSIFGAGREARERAEAIDKFISQVAALNVDLGDLDISGKAQIKALMTPFLTSGVASMEDLLGALGLTQADLGLSIGDKIGQMFTELSNNTGFTNDLQRAAAAVFDGRLGKIADEFGVGLSDIIGDWAALFGVSADDINTLVSQWSSSTGVSVDPEGGLSIDPLKGMGASEGITQKINVVLDGRTIASSTAPFMAGELEVRGTNF